MRKLFLSLLLASALPLAAQVQTSTFVADLSPTMQNPPLEEVEASGHAVVTITTRSENDAVVSAIVDFRIMATTGQTENILVFHVHRGGAGMNGPVVIDPDFGGEMVGPGSAIMFESTGVVTDAAVLGTIEAIRGNPSGFYVNVHSQSNPPGLIRGQLRRADHMMLSMLLQRAADSEAVDASQSADIEAIKANVAAIARRMGLVPEE